MIISQVYIDWVKIFILKSRNAKNLYLIKFDKLRKNFEECLENTLEQLRWIDSLLETTSILNMKVQVENRIIDLALPLLISLSLEKLTPQLQCIEGTKFYHERESQEIIFDQWYQLLLMIWINEFENEIFKLQNHRQQIESLTDHLVWLWQTEWNFKWRRQKWLRFQTILFFRIRKIRENKLRVGIRIKV